MLHLPKSLLCVLLLAAFQFSSLDATAQPPATASVYEWRSDLGGWLDTSNNLVWGYSSTGILGYGINYSRAQDFAADYGSELLDAGYVDEADIASHFTWRLPSLAEYQNAYNKGLFWEDGVSGIYDQSPASGFQSTTYGYLKWTSTLGLKKDNKKVYYFDTTWGSSGTATKTSQINTIVVRKHNP